MYNLARFEMYYVLQKDGLSLSQIGAVFNRDHSTILHGIQRWKEMIGE
jgi:chromosomal replication initiation ATPase DnaA